MTELLTTAEVADMVDTTKYTVLWRAKKLGLKSSPQKRGKSMVFTLEQVELIKHYEPGPRCGRGETIAIKEDNNPLRNVSYFVERANALISRHSTKTEAQCKYG